MKKVLHFRKGGEGKIGGGGRGKGHIDKMTRNQRAGPLRSQQKPSMHTPEQKLSGFFEGRGLMLRVKGGQEKLAERGGRGREGVSTNHEDEKKRRNTDAVAKR